MKTLSNEITFNLAADADVLVKAFIAPIAHTVGGFHKEWDALANLRVAEPEKQHRTSVFQSFLPAKPVSVGDCWQIDETGITALLRQLHPNPNFDMHLDAGDSNGLWACLRAYNDGVADIVFRIHAEFAITDGWFTPSQFAGHLIIDRLEGKIAAFEMSVPEGTLNFDVNWETTLEGWDAPRWITDCGYCSQMELCAGTQDFLQDTEFREAITQEKAECLLILQFYESRRINWVSLAEALEMAPAQQKPIHVISLDGPLADEAC